MTGRQKEASSPKSVALDHDLIERATQLIDKGRSPAPRGRTPSAAQAARDADVDATLEQYFTAIRALDVQDALGALRYSAATDDEIKHAVKQLAAYFRWTALTGTTHTVDRAPIEPLAAQFAVVLSYRLTGGHGEALPDDASFWPVWRRPDVALGWAKPNQRVADPRIAERDLLIIQEAAIREAAIRAAAKQEAAKQEAVKRKTAIRKIAKRKPAKRKAARKPTAGSTRLISPETAKALGRQFSLSPAAIRAAVRKHAEAFLLLTETASKPN